MNTFVYAFNLIFINYKIQGTKVGLVIEYGAEPDKIPTSQSLTSHGEGKGLKK